MRHLNAYVSTLRWFAHHPRQARSRIGRREIRRARIWVHVIRRELAETRAQLAPRVPWPAYWYGQAMCIHRYEAVDWHERRNPSSRGGMQIQYATWSSVGGRGDPADASPGEQLLRAFFIWHRDGGSWREWTTAGKCGLA